MNRHLLIILPLALFFLIPRVTAQGISYYLSQSDGNDLFDGQSPSTPWKTLAKASKAYFTGDKILLKCGDVWTDEKLNLTGDGTPGNPIVLTSYGTGDKPVLKRSSVGAGQICVELTNPSGWRITRLKFDTGLFGVYLHWEADYDNESIGFEDCEFYGFDSQDYTYGYPCGIWFKILNGDAAKTYCSDITVTRCYFQDCLNGVDVYAFTGNNRFLSSTISYKNVDIGDCYGYSCGSCPVGVANTTGGSIHDNTFVGNSDHYNSTGSCGGFLIWVKDYSVVRNEYAYTQRKNGDYDGCAFDFEGKCVNVTFRDNYVHDTHGCGVYLYDNGGVGGNTGIHISNNLFSNDAINPPSVLQKNVICYGNGTHSGTVDSNIFYLASGVPAYNVASGFSVSSNTLTNFLETNPENLASTAVFTHSSDSAAGAWFQLEWDTLNTINKVVVTQPSGSSITRYVVQSWDSAQSAWKDAFNGINLETTVSKIMPIRTVVTRKIRLFVYSTGSGLPALTDLAAYDVTHTTVAPSDTGWKRVDDTDSRITYADCGIWSNPLLYGGTDHNFFNAGASAAFAFNGTGIRWIGVNSSGHGNVDVYIDNMSTPVATVNTEAAVTAFNVVEYENVSLSPGPHVIKLVNKDQGKYSDVDAFEYRDSSLSTTVVSAPGPEEEITLSIFPAPFNPSATLSFHLPRRLDVTIDLLTIRGGLVKTILHQPMAAGFHSVAFDSRSLSSGTYLCRMVAGGRKACKKVTLLK